MAKAWSVTYVEGPWAGEKIKLTADLAPESVRRAEWRGVYRRSKYDDKKRVVVYTYRQDEKK